MRIVAAIAEWAKERCFPAGVWQKLEALGAFAWCREFPKAGDSVERFLAGIKDAEILVTAWGSPRITLEILSACPKLAYIAHAAGTVAWIDLAAWRRGIRVSNVMPVMALGVSEFTVTCMLNGLRRFDAFIKPERWDSLPFYRVPRVGFMLRGRTVGLVGLGIIGRQTLDLLRPFGCKVLVHDPYLAENEAENLGVQRVDLDTLMRLADVVSLHAPGTPATRHIINRARLEMLKPGAVLVNTARGVLIDHEALAVVAGAGAIGVYLDVTDPEPLGENHRLRGLANVVITPHVAGPTVEAWPLMGAACVADVERFVRGEPLKYEVSEGQYGNQSTT